MDQIRVLTATNYPVVRQGIARVTQRAPDIKVIGDADAGPGAIEKSVNLRPDVVLLDVNPGRADSLNLVKQFAEAVHDISIIVFTGVEQEECIFQSFSAGALGYLLKTADDEMILDAIRTVYAGDLFVGSRVMAEFMRDFARYVRTQSLEGPSHGLSGREREVLSVLAEGRTEKEIARQLFISPYTVKTYRQRIMRKLGLRNRIELVKYALRAGLIDLDD